MGLEECGFASVRLRRPEPKMAGFIVFGGISKVILTI